MNVTLAQIFAHYRAMVLPAAEPAQIDEARNAFFAGAAAVLTELLKMGDPDYPDEEGVDRIAALNMECTGFARTVVDDFIAAEPRVPAAPAAPAGPAACADRCLLERWLQSLGGSDRDVAARIFDHALAQWRRANGKARE